MEKWFSAVCLDGEMVQCSV